MAAQEVVRDAKGAPVVFISYTHQSPPHKEWVKTLTTDLRAEGIDAILDQFRVKYGDDLTLFMEQGIREAKRVLLICTPEYARKANDGQGGVGYERLVVTGELARTIDTNKFICVLREGTIETAVPTFAQSRRYIDFTGGQDYKAALDDLVRDLYDEPATPEPPLGPNPFAGDGPPAALTRSSLVPLDGSSDVEDVANRAERLLREHDMLGWKRLVRTVRQELDGRLTEWQEEFGSVAPGADWDAALAEAVEALAPFLVLALTGIESSHPEAARHDGFLDDLIALQTAGYGRPGHVADVPSALAMTFHYVVGAFLVAERKNEDAIALLTQPFQMPYDRPYRPLWKQPALIGWNKALAGTCTVSWSFLSRATARHAWLGRFFVRPADYTSNLRAYQLLASLLEMSEHAGEGGILDPRKEYTLSVPPMFLAGDDGESIDRIIRRALPDASVVRSVAAHGGASVAALEKSWPAWYTHWFLWWDRVYHSSVSYQSETPPLVPRGIVKDADLR